MSHTPTPKEMLVAIHAKCLDCSGGSRREVHGCKLRDCPLWPYRKGEAKAKPGHMEGQISLFEIEREGA